MTMTTKRRKRFVAVTTPSETVPLPIPPDLHQLEAQLGTSPPPAGFKLPYKTVLVLMTEDLALLLLRLGGNFRKVSAATISQYANVMNDGGRWHYLMEPIYVDANLHLIQGQHRLQAYVNYLREGGAPQVQELRLGTPTEWSMVMDSGMKRNNAQRVASLGYANNTKLSAAAICLWQISQQGFIGGLKSDADTVPNVLGPADNPNLATYYLSEGVRLVGNLRKNSAKPTGVTEASMAVAVALMLYNNESGAILFMEEATLVARNAAKAATGFTNLIGDGATGPAALARFLQDRHAVAADPSRYRRHLRALTAAWMLWTDPALTYRALEKRFGGTKKGTEEFTSERTDAQWDVVSADVISEIQKLLAK